MMAGNVVWLNDIYPICTYLNIGINKLLVKHFLIRSFYMIVLFGHKKKVEYVKV